MALKDLLKKAKNAVTSAVKKVASTVKNVASKIVPTIAEAAPAVFTTVAQACTGNISGAVASAASVANIVQKNFVGSGSSGSVSSSGNSVSSVPVVVSSGEDKTIGQYKKDTLNLRMAI